MEGLAENDIFLYRIEVWIINALVFKTADTLATIHTRGEEIRAPKVKP